ncbi:universal stress protein UspE [Alteromonas sp. ASW11-36]|uniref:Universal stress protein UspE n=1 Tax=Alteromonas arenosi TaxID=3055817 RepID=A0ABT7SXC1_9ALTE|nr:universal stress protein UspE [Alteromonas sp. ASW11-36]MDM7860827.1 universal stress protein UspE [Alteromonas sp. ASW11-36]
MATYQNLLVVIDPESESQPALARACLLARKTRAKVTAFMCIYDFSYEMTTMLSHEERDAMRQAVLTDRAEWLQNICKTYDSPEEVETCVVWDNSVYSAAIKHAIQIKADLIIKAANSHDDLASLIFTPTDWHLLRKSPTSVLMVKQHDWPENGNVIAAVNVGTEDNQHQALNDKVTNTAKLITELLGARLHLVNAYPGTPLNLAIEIPEFDPQGYTSNVKHHHEKEMQAFAGRHGVHAEVTHVKQGLPEVAIPTVAADIDAELVVIGTIGRVGLSAALIGNTAEHVIDALNCDVLAIKPDGFQSPIKS